VSIVHVLRDMDPMTCPTLPLSSLVRHGAYISVTKSQGYGRVDTSEDPQMRSKVRGTAGLARQRIPSRLSQISF
jgi:hypothetical protein